MFKMAYWLPRQNKIVGAPQYYETDDREDFVNALEMVINNGYEIEFATDESGCAMFVYR